MPNCRIRRDGSSIRKTWYQDREEERDGEQGKPAGPDDDWLKKALNELKPKRD